MGRLLRVHGGLIGIAAFLIVLVELLKPAGLA